MQMDELHSSKIAFCTNQQLVLLWLSKITTEMLVIFVLIYLNHAFVSIKWLGWLQIIGLILDNVIMTLKFICELNTFYLSIYAIVV